MKKLLSVILCAAICGAAFIGAAACNNKPEDPHDTETLSIYAPDGAPALALANLIAGEEAKEGGDYSYDVHIVDASTVQTYVAGNDPKADFCILPVNAAATVIGDGTAYRMLGTVTNGNLYFLSSGDNPALTGENIKTALLGKTLGVIQYAQVPGLTLRVVLNKYNIPYGEVESNADALATQVNIRALAAAQVTPATGCDYYLCPEPARTTKITATSGALKAAGSLQELYGGEGGYPQAVLVAKLSLLNKATALNEVISYMEGSAEYLKDAQPETVLSLLDGKRTAGMDASFNAGNLNAEVIANCSVRFTKSADCKEKVLSFLDEFRAIAPATGTPADAFFYIA